MKTILFYLISACLTSHQDSSKNQLQVPAFVAAPSANFNAPINSLRCSLRDDRVFLNWNIESNQAVDQFAIERSPNGKVFYPTGLVFSTEKTGKDQYIFFEKAKEENVAYRVLIIYKDQTVAYSPVVYVNSEATSN